MKTINDLFLLLKESPDEIDFFEVIQLITDNYNYSPCAFHNADIFNDMGVNVGSCKIFAFAQRHNLTETETLALFGHFYRDEVLEDPNGSSHANIRQFMKTGWGGISWAQANPLSNKI